MASSGDDAAPRGLLIDWGGVMTSNMFETFSGFCKREGLSPDVVAKQFRNDPASRELLVGLETGVLPEEQFQVEFAAILGVPPSELIDRMFADGRLDEPMIDAVRNARRAGIKTCLLSNSWGTRRYDRARRPSLGRGHRHRRARSSLDRAHRHRRARPSLDRAHRHRRARTPLDRTHR